MESKLNTIAEAIEDIKQGRVVIVVDDEDRENEGDFLTAARNVTPEIINFMATHGRGLICAPLVEDRCDELGLELMVKSNSAAYETPFTVSVDLMGHGCTTGISASDRYMTVKALIDPATNPAELGKPGHIFPLRAKKGGVLRRAGHTEAGCDLAAMAGLSPASVICEIMKDDGTMARLPDLMEFAAEHGLKIGTIADLIEHRSRTESLVQRLSTRTLVTAHGEFTVHAYKDLPSDSVHLALVRGDWSADTAVLARVHEPLSVLDALEPQRAMHSWSLDAARKRISDEQAGVLVLLNCGESGEQLLAQFEGLARSAQAPERGRMDLRTYGIGAQILRDCGVHKMRLMGNPRRMPSMAGYGLEITGYLAKE